MRATLIRLSLVLAAALSLAACRNDSVVAPPQRPIQVSGPSNVLLGNPIVSITAGQYHTCYRRYYGATYCWGLDDFGQLGIGAAPNSCAGANLYYPHGYPPYACATTPTQIPNFTFGAVAAGETHSCGIRGTSDHTVWCWGALSAYELGTSTSISSVSPRQISSQPFTTISAGLNESCGTVAGTSPQSTLFCWGQNHNPSQPSYFYTPTAVNLPAGVAADFAQSTIGTTGGTVCAIWSDYVTMALYCMGDNDFGQAAVDPTQTSFATLTQVPVVPSGTPPGVGTFSSCVDMQGGGVACWGSNNYGQLGTTAVVVGGQTYVPVSVASKVSLHGVVVASNYACALDDAGNPWCWGGHSFFDGTTTQSPATVMMVGGGHTYSTLTAGYQHVCGIGLDKHVWCWGDNSVGQLGNGTSGGAVAAATPVLVSGT